MSLEVSTPSYQCDLSALMPPSTANHECPKTVFGKSCIVNCSSGHVPSSGTAAFIVLAGGSDGSLTKARYFTCEAPTCFFGHHLLNSSLSAFDCASSTMGESCAVTSAEDYQVANEITGTLTCACDEAARDVVLEVAVSKRLVGRSFA